MHACFTSQTPQFIMATVLNACFVSLTTFVTLKHTTIALPFLLHQHNVLNYVPCHEYNNRPQMSW